MVVPILNTHATLITVLDFTFKLIFKSIANRAIPNPFLIFGLISFLSMHQLKFGFSLFFLFFPYTLFIGRRMKFSIPPVEYIFWYPAISCVNFLNQQNIHRNGPEEQKAQSLVLIPQSKCIIDHVPNSESNEQKHAHFMAARRRQNYYGVIPPFVAGQKNAVQVPNFLKSARKLWHLFSNDQRFVVF